MTNPFIAYAVASDFDVACSPVFQATGVELSDYSLHDYVTDASHTNSRDCGCNRDVSLYSLLSGTCGADCETDTTIHIPENINITYFGVIFTPPQQQ